MQPRGTRVITDATKYRQYVNKCATYLETLGYNETLVNSIDYLDTYKNKMGSDVENQLYTFQDKKGRDLCLRPEVTATFQQLYTETEKDQKYWYFEKCWRYERPQKGRYREFYQLGVEIINPSKDYTDELTELAETLVRFVTSNYETNTSAKRGLSYYKDGQGFEITCPELGAQKQVVGGGQYKEGIGFAIGVDRLLLTNHVIIQT